MARYIEKEKFLKKIDECFGHFGVMVKAIEEIAEKCATADVASKSEVYRVYYNLQAVLEERAETKQEIAREIFEEIENNYADFLFDGYRNIVVLTEKDFAELKKKYTEDEQ